MRTDLLNCHCEEASGYRPYSGLAAADNQQTDIGGPSQTADVKLKTCAIQESMLMKEKARCERNSRLLIIEDDESQLRTLTAIMEEEGFDVIGCSTVSEALEHLDHLKTGVVVPDQCLPECWQ